MIEVFLPNTVQRTFDGIVVKMELEPLGVLPPSSIPETDPEAPCTCCFGFTVFGNGTQAYHNDKTAVIERRYLPTDTVDFYLQKDGVDVGQLNSTAYGHYWDFDQMTAYDEQRDYKAYLINWDAVLTAHGAGTYRVRKNMSLQGAAAADYFDKCEFKLLPYSFERAHGTVRIECWNNAQTVRETVFNLDGQNFYSSYRVPGRFDVANPELEQNHFVGLGHESKQNIDKLMPRYKLKTQPVPYCMVRPLWHEVALAGECKITAFNRYSHSDELTQLPVKVVAIDGLELDDPLSENREVTMTFGDRFDDLQRRNYR